MNWVSGLAAYAIIGWLLLFMALPWGVRLISREEVEKGQDAGAPRHPRLRIKVGITTALSSVVWGIVYAVPEAGLMSFRAP
jgi:predicted secreted protein